MPLYLTFTDLSPLMMITQIGICLTSAAIVCSMHKYAPDRHIIRWMLIMIIISSGWAFLSSYNQTPDFYLSILVFSFSVLLTLLWTIWFHVWKLPTIRKYEFFKNIKESDNA